MAEQYREESSQSDSYRAGYLESVKSFLSREQARAEERRAAFITPEKLAADPEGYRARYLSMLGIPLSDYKTYAKDPVKVLEDTLVTRTETHELRRMRLEVTEGFAMYGILFLPLSGITENTPFVLSQHGGLGTPEVCSDFFGDNNYNHQTNRLLARGAVVFAAQLLLWNKEAYGNPYDRQKLDSDLKQVGSSITALEVFGLMRCLDYFVTQPCCNPDHIGMAGLSYGGFYTLMTAAADPRIRSAYASCSFTDKIRFNWPDWTWKSSAETFLDAEVAALIAPRAIAFDAGEKDPLFGADGTRKEFARAKEYFRAQGAEDNLFLLTFDGSHEMARTDEGMDFLFAHL